MSKQKHTALLYEIIYDKTYHLVTKKYQVLEYNDYPKRDKWGWVDCWVDCEPHISHDITRSDTKLICEKEIDNPEFDVDEEIFISERHSMGKVVEKYRTTDNKTLYILHINKFEFNDDKESKEKAENELVKALQDWEDNRINNTDTLKAKTSNLNKTFKQKLLDLFKWK